MSGALQAVSQNLRSFGSPPPGAIGSAYEGGFYAGQISTTANGVATHYLIVAPSSSGQTEGVRWKWAAYSNIPGADSVIDGPQNTADIVANSASNISQAAHFCNNASIGGFTDWYMPAKNELEVCYFNLKPSSPSNNTTSGTNTNAVPSRGSNYTLGTPARTSLPDWRFPSPSPAFSNAAYWSSTEFSASGSWVQSFYVGNQYSSPKDWARSVRAVRRLAI